MSILNVVANATQNNNAISISVAIIINLLLISILLRNQLPVLALLISKPQSTRLQKDSSQ